MNKQTHLYTLQLGPQSIVWFTSSATRPNLEFKNPTYLGWKNKVSTTANMVL